ncbi:hypothetical protein Tco_0378912 [Tanacetum coccineum]
MIKINKRVTKLDIIPNIKQAPQIDRQIVSYFVDPYEPPIPFPRRLEQHAEEALVRETMESLKKIRINRALLFFKISYLLKSKIQEVSFYHVLLEGMGKLKPINMVVEMADNTKSIPKGIVKHLLIRIDKFIFPVDFVVLDMIKDFRMPIILWRLLLATTHAKVDIFGKSISLEVGNEKVIFKMRSSFTTTIFESIRAIKSKIHMGDDNLIDYESCEFDQLLGIDPDIFAYDVDIQGSYKEEETDQEKSKEYETVKETKSEQRLNPAKERVHWCEAISQKKEGVRKYWASCDPYNDICNGGGLPNNVEKLYWESTNDNKQVDLEWEELSFNNWVRIKFGRVCKMTKDRILKDYWREIFNKAEMKGEEKEDPEEFRENKTNVMLEIILDKIDETLFSNTSDDKDDLEGIIDYLEPTSYDRFIDSENEAYKERSCKLLGMPYRIPPPISIERVKVTRYNIGLGKTYKKIKVLGIDEIPRTSANVATVRASIMDKIGLFSDFRGNEVAQEALNGNSSHSAII